MEQESRPGYYKDIYGNWQKERRKMPDRRRLDGGPSHHERRVFFRRKADRELLEKNHRQMIQEALEDFAEEHHRPPSGQHPA